MVRDLETKYSYPIAGTLRVGEKKGNIPTSLNYFTVHEDSHTQNDVIELFDKAFGEKPKEVIIKFLSNDPFKVDYIRYAKSGLQCIGDGEKASYRKDDKWCECECSKECEYRDNKCKMTGRLDFLIKDVDIGGAWRFQTRSYNTIGNIFRTLNYLRCMNHDITKSYFKLIVSEKTTNAGGETKKFITVDLKELVNKEQFINRTNEVKQAMEEKPKVEQKQEEITTTMQENSADEFEKCLSLIEINDFTIKDKSFKEAVFCNMNDETVRLVIHPDILEEVCSWQIGSAIIPTKILEKNNYKTLVEYKDMGILKK